MGYIELNAFDVSVVDIYIISNKQVNKRDGSNNKYAVVKSRCDIRLL